MVGWRLHHLLHVQRGRIIAHECAVIACLIIYLIIY
jgi:hypothetical protein